MNLASFLLCLVFAGVGYVAYPIILPKLIDAKLVSEASLSDDYKVDVTEKADGDEVASEEGGEGGAVVSGDDVRKPVVPMLPDEVERPAKPSKPRAPVASEVVAEVKPEMVREKMPEVVAESADEVVPEVQPEPVAPKVSISDKQFTEILKSSVEAGDVNEFKSSQVLSWKREGEELMGGESYEVGMVTYKAQTIFDEQELKAKALVKDGKVVRWLWPSTNTEMR